MSRGREAQAFRWGQLISGLESAQASLKLALRTSDLLNDHDKEFLHDTLEGLAGVEQRSWAVHDKGGALDTPSKQRHRR